MGRPRRAEDAHHLLWVKRNWGQGYCKALRNHAWLKVYIPRDTLHRQIHHEIATIPLAKTEDAKRVFELLVRLEAKGELDSTASIEERLDFLIEHLQTQATVKALIKQREIVRKFYERGSE